MMISLFLELQPESASGGGVHTGDCARKSAGGCLSLPEDEILDAFEDVLGERLRSLSGCLLPLLTERGHYHLAEGGSGIAALGEFGLRRSLRIRGCLLGGLDGARDKRDGGTACLQYLLHCID